jgi:hypothetical protein
VPPIYAYLDDSGSLAVNTAGYEVTLEMPASNFYNFAYYNPDDAAPASAWCMFQPGNYGGSIEPSIAYGNYRPAVQIYDAVYGWRTFRNVENFVTRRGPLAGYGNSLSSVSGPPFTINYPPRLRIAYIGYLAGPTVSWTGLNVGFDDVCFTPPPEQPEVHLGYAETTLFLDTRTPRQGGLGRLPNGAPLAGRNRVQLIG